MKEIIEEISRIDAIAYENEQQNKTFLSNEKVRLENEINKYRQQKLEIANNNAKIIYNQIVINAKNEYQLQEEKIKRITNQIAENYIKVEKDIIQDVFNKLFL